MPSKDSIQKHPMETNSRLAQDIISFYSEIKPKIQQELNGIKELRESSDLKSSADLEVEEILNVEIEIDHQLMKTAYPAAFETLYNDTESPDSSQSVDNTLTSFRRDESQSLLSNSIREDEKEEMWYDGFTQRKKPDWKKIAKREAKSYFPPISWVPEYFNWQRLKKDLKSDIIAGFTVGVLLIPQGMAYSLVTGLDPIYGLYSSFIPLLIYPFFATSRQLGVGPTALLSLLTNSALKTLNVPEEEYPTWAFLIAFFAGCINLLFGALRLGFVVNFLSHSVISGFTSAASIIIGFSQIKHILGVSPEDEEYFVVEVYRLCSEIPHTHWPTLLMGLGFVALLLFLKFFQFKIKIRGKRRTIHFRKIPSAVVSVFLGVLLCYFIWLGEGWDDGNENTVGGIKLLGEIPPGLPSPLWPFAQVSLNWSKFGELIVLCIPICLLSFIESYSVAKFFATKYNYEINANQEAIGLGLASMGGSFFRSFPVTGGLSRTAVNASAGSKSPLSSIIASLIIMLTLLVLTPVFQFLPKNLLGAIIVTAVSKLFDFDEMKFTWKTNKTDFFVLIVSFLCTLLIGVEIGVGVAIGVSLLLVIFLSSRPRVALLGRLPGTHLYRNARNPHWKDKGIQRTKGVIILRPDSNIYFANAGYMEKTVESNLKEADDAIYTLIFDFSSVGDIDASGLHALKEINTTLQGQDIVMYIAHGKIPVINRMKRAGLIRDDVISSRHLFESLHQAVKEAQSQVLQRSAMLITTESSNGRNNNYNESNENNENDQRENKHNHQDTEMKNINNGNQLYKNENYV